jgi:hypothetical protein
MLRNPIADVIKTRSLISNTPQELCDNSNFVGADSALSDERILFNSPIASSSIISTLNSGQRSETEI